MTQRSPSRSFVVGVVSPASDQPSDLATVVEALRLGEFTGAVDGIIVATARVPPSGALAELRGVAQMGELATSVDPAGLQPARALRRALADGRMHASDIGYACASVPANNEAAGLAILERGLGRFAPTARLEVAPDSLVRAVKALAGTDARAIGAVALVIEPGVGTIALAFGRP